MINKMDSVPRKKTILTILPLMALVIVLVGVTLAYLFTATSSITNVFLPSKVEVDVEEIFDNNVKTSISVMNTGDTKAFVRLKLISYRENVEGDKIGGETSIPDFILNEGWFLKDGYYYYTQALEPGVSTPNLLAEESNITLVSYDDVDGGVQVIEVLAEGIQSYPDSAVTSSWDVAVLSGALVND